jgi:hypothetical protein
MDSVMAKKKPSRQRLWTKDEVRELRALAKQRLTAAIIARRLKRSLDSTKRKASVLGVPLGAAVRWTKDDLQKLRSLAAKKQPLPTIARALKRTEAAIEKMASNVGISLDMQDSGDPGMPIRLPVALRHDVDKWAAAQSDRPSRSEAVRRLLERALRGPPSGQRKPKARSKA